MNDSRWVATMVAVIAMPAVVLAQQGASHKRPADEAFKMVEAYVIANVQESLELTDEQFVKLLPSLKRQQTERREFNRNRQRALRDLNRTVRGGDTEQRIVAALDHLKQIEAGSFEARRQRYAEIDAELSPIQQAKLRVFEFEIERRIRDLMRRVRGGQQQRQDRPREPGTRPR